MSYKLLIGIVPHDSGELICNAAKSAGAGGGTIAMGRGTASNGVLQLLGLGDTSKDIVYIIIKNELKAAVYEAIKTASEKKAHFGVMFTLETQDFIRAGHINEKAEGTEGEENMKTENNYQMINIIVNKGYAEDAMAAQQEMKQLRASGEVVIVDYLNEGASSLHCNRVLQQQDDQWQVLDLEQE